MTVSETLYQIGICPNCGPNAEQRFLFATEDRYGPVIEKGRIVAYEQVETLSLFHCEKCGSNLAYLTDPEIPNAISVDELDLHEPEEVAELDTKTFLELSTLVWPKRVGNSLSHSVPTRVREIYEEALLVKNVSPSSFAVQVGRALEAVQDDLRIPRNGLEMLDSQSPGGLSQIAIRIKDWRNAAAHSDGFRMTAEEVEDIDSFFRLITEYVYELPQRLEKARTKVEVVIDASTSGGEIVH